MTPDRAAKLRSSRARGAVRIAVSVVLLATTFSAAYVLGAAPPSPARPQAELDALRKQLEKLESDITRSEGTRNEVADRLRESERAISQTTRGLRELATQQAQIQSELRGYREQTSRLSEEIAGMEQELGRFLYARYIAGRQGPAALLLSGENPNRIARELHYFSYVSRAQAQLIDSLRADAARLSELERQTRVKAQELAALESRQRADRKRLIGERERRQIVLNQTAAEIGRQRREVETLKRNEQRLVRLIQQLAEAVKAAEAARRNDKIPLAGGRGGVFSSLKGRLRLPVAGELIGRFGAPIGDGGVSSKGVFIRAPSGKEVHAVAGGRVVFADWMRGFGNLLIVDHGEGYMTIYGNNESLFKRPGDAVRTGDTVATVGSTGGSEESGLYFEIRHQGRAVDPMGWVSTK